MLNYNISWFPVNSASRNLHLSIDHALATSYRRNAYNGQNAYVAHISLVKGIPFYGYHVGYCFYFKIYLLNPVNIIRLADLLRQGAVMKRPLQPYESHLQYIPQWLCDYNLYGCGYMDCAKVKFRHPVPRYLELENPAHRWHDHSIPPDMVSDESRLPKQSHCSLEIDVSVRDILNRHEVTERPLHFDFVERENPLSLDHKFVQSMAGLWQDETRRRKKRLGIQDAGSTPFLPEELVSMSADPRDEEEGGWIHEKEFREIIERAVEEERRNSESDGGVSFEEYVRKQPFEDKVQTALDSIQELFSETFGPLAFHDEQTDQGLADAKLEVDEDLLLYYEQNNSQEDNDSEPQDSGCIGSAPVEFALEGLASSIMASEEDDLLLSSDRLETASLQPEHHDFHGGPYGDKKESAEDGQSVPLEKRRADNTAYNRFSKAGDIYHSTNNPIGPSDLSTGKKTTLLQPDIEMNDIALDAFSDLFTDSSSQSQKLMSQKNYTNEPLSQSSRLNFPVVKDPSDPVTLLRFSQKSLPSKEGHTSAINLSDSLFESSRKSELGTTPVLAADPLTDPPKGVNFGIRVAESIREAFGISCDRKVYCFREPCPTPSHVASTVGRDGRPSVIYQNPFYSDDRDVPDRQREYAGKEFRLGSNTLHFLPPFHIRETLTSSQLEKVTSTYPNADRLRRQDENIRRLASARIWEFASVPPTRSEVVAWFEQENELSRDRNQHLVSRSLSKLKPNVLSQIETATQRDPHAFKFSLKQQSTSVEYPTQYMSIMSVEVHVNTRDKLSPNPEYDEIACVFWSLQSDDDFDVFEPTSGLENVRIGIIAQSESGDLNKVMRSLTVDVEQESTELDLIMRLVDIVRLYDPDILTGYEVHNSSWGFIIERARLKYDYDLCEELSRTKSQSHGRFGKGSDRWGFRTTSVIRITGRHLINIWRAMSSELNLLQYTMESVAYHLLHRRVPHFPFETLTKWYKSGKPRDMMKVIDYFVSRSKMDLEILESNELIPRISEQARLLGVDFFSVFSRGSQFKVESLMFRIAKPENFILISPGRKQVGQQNALECLPLVMEPQSDFYTSPVLVLDFQSLYPSTMIAYNYCYSTFLGRVVRWRGKDKMGFTDYNRQPRLLELLKDKINISPNGMIYAKPEIRKSLLARMLSEILETRVMVKGGMKVDAEDKTLQRLLNNRQLALKLIANVTYGYTSASFSGRMPCSEIADSIVQTGRETLERAVALIHAVPRWGAEVVYGDTDSIFVHLKGRSRAEAFDIGEEIARAVTNSNPRPVKLKFEKVYHPCVLLAKKRYVGFKYEHRDQREPEFDAKGIETVRRDGTPAEQKIEEKALKILFKTADLSQVKSYFQKQCSKIMQGRVSIQDFCFAREVRLGSYSEKGLLPPGAMISTKKMLMDPRLEPQYGERVPYVVVTGSPGARLIDRCVAPDVLLQNTHLELDAEYYISKNIIPPLERIFNLVGANVRQWYDEMPKQHRVRRVETSIPLFGSNGGPAGRGSAAKKTLESYMKSSSCLVCKDKLENASGELPICTPCLANPQQSLYVLTPQLNRAEKRVLDLHKICRSCMGVPFGDSVECDSKDCPVFYSRTRDMSTWKHLMSVLEPVCAFLEKQSDRSLEW